MDKQGHMEAVKGDIQQLRPKEPTKEMNEEQFLKELYVFMRKRDTPIERIPHLGFKQIDLFVMFKTVNDLGGYSQVTSQQMWKQVYNTLGGNPRSTSAATCTRRHYEKLLLPYECHMKGIVMTTIPQHQMKPLPYITYGKSDDCGPRPPKRPLLLSAHQAPHPLQPNPRGSLYPLPLPYPHFFPPVLPPYVPISPPVMTPQRPTAPKPQFPITPSPVNLLDTGAQGLTQLRMLSRWYKTSSGLDDEPLNLSPLRKLPQEPSSCPVSSFSPPSSSKTPKFLNKPSTLYTTQHGGAPRSEGSETQEGDPGEGGSTYLYPATTRESGKDSSSPVYTLSSESEKDDTSPKTDFPVRSREADREGSADLKALGIKGLGHTLLDLSPEKESKMEIEIPLSVFQSLFKQYKPSAPAYKAKEAPLFAQHEYLRQCKWIDTDGFNANLTFQLNPQNSPQDLRVRKVPSPTPNAQTAGKRHSPSHNHLNGYSALPSGGILRNAISRDVYPLDQPDINNSFSSKSPHMSWGALDKEEQPRVKSDGSPHGAQPDFALKFCTEDMTRRARQKSEVESSAVLMVNSNSLLQLTTEEVMKLKKMISSSS